MLNVNKYKGLLLLSKAKVVFYSQNIFISSQSFNHFVISSCMEGAEEGKSPLFSFSPYEVTVPYDILYIII